MIILASDHAGFLLKEKLKKYFKQNNMPFIDVGANEIIPDDDYPDYAKKASELVLSDEKNKGVFVCGTGIGMAIAANKVKGIFASNITSAKFARLASSHNHINVITLSGRFTSFNNAKKIVRNFLNTQKEEGRHTRRIQKIES